MIERVAFVVVAHHDDWQLFIGATAFELLRDPACRVVIVVTTAGDAGDEAYHWKSRFAGAVASVLSGLNALNPYDRETARMPEVPLRSSIDFACVEVASKSVLRAQVRSAGEVRAVLYALHLPDGGTGSGFAPAFESLEQLHGGKSATTLWPAPGVRYACWRDFEAVLEAIVASERLGESAATLFAANPDPAMNPGDHSDHRFTSIAVRSIAQADARLRVVWFSTYANASREPNLDERGAREQRALVYAYAGGYAGCASPFAAELRTGWQREHDAFKGREYTVPAHQEESNSI